MLKNVVFLGFTLNRSIRSPKKEGACFSRGFRPHLELLVFMDMSEILHISDLEMSFGHTFRMIMHDFASRKQKNIVFPVKVYAYIQNGPGSEKTK